MSVTLIRMGGLSLKLLPVLLASSLVLAVDEVVEENTVTDGAAFWRWFDEFADAQGEVLDPADYALISQSQFAVSTSLPKREVMVSDDLEKEPVP